MAKAQVGDLIRVVDASITFSSYTNGDIFEVVEREHSSVLVNAYWKGDEETEENRISISDCEYVIHRKAGEEDAPKTEVIAGVGPDAPVVENEYGAKQSQSPYRMDLIDAKALLKIAEVHKQGGDKYGDTNWHNIPVNDHINHALVHIYAHLAEDTSDEHLAHAATRMIFALALQLRKTIIE